MRLMYKKSISVLLVLFMFFINIQAGFSEEFMTEVASQDNLAQASCACPCSQSIPCNSCPSAPCVQYNPCCPQTAPCNSCVQPTYVVCPACPQQVPVSVEHLPTYKGSTINMVKLYGNMATIVANNVLKVTFSGDFNSKNICEDNRVSFILQEGLTTCEGRQLLPCGTRIIGRIQCVENPKWLNRNAKVYIVFEEMVLPNCSVIPLCAKVYGKDSVLKKSSWAAVGKAAAYTVGLFGIGTGLGAAIGAAAHSMGNGAGFGALAFGMPIGGGVGLLTGVLTPGLHYKAKCGKEIYIQLSQDLVLCYN